ncbi:hypothetical protein HanRHA438_Chr16g0786191 [Helianthus annuus]|nr:hypothetical protein HanRHA438_Chr16g0786191 [Helianthus annuus]
MHIGEVSIIPTFLFSLSTNIMYFQIPSLLLFIGTPKVINFAPMTVAQRWLGYVTYLHFNFIIKAQFRLLISPMPNPPIHLGVWILLHSTHLSLCLQSLRKPSRV